MSCCGGNRARVTPIARIASQTQPASSTPAPRVRATIVVVRNDGGETLIVFGSVTGKKYRLGPAVEVAVDIRDRVSMTKLANVRELRLA